MYTIVSQDKSVFQVGSTMFVLNCTATNIGTIHRAIKDLVEADPQKLNRFEELLTWNPDFAYAIFCFENGIIIPPDEVIPPADENL